VLAQLLAFFDDMQGGLITNPVLRIHSVRGRVKDAVSLWRKWEKKMLDNPLIPARDRLAEMTDGDEIVSSMLGRFSDVVGVRIVCNTLVGKQHVSNMLETFGPSAPHRLFSALTRANAYYKDSGYRSVHFDARVARYAWPGLAANPRENDEGVGIEIQVRTIIEEAWGEIQHDLLYKASAGTSGVPSESQDMFLALSHRLHEVDLNVQRLTKPYEKKLEKETRSLRAARAPNNQCRATSNCCCVSIRTASSRYNNTCSRSKSCGQVQSRGGTGRQLTVTTHS